MTPNGFNDSLFSFIRQSPTPFHAVGVVHECLRKHGFSLLDEGAPWQLAHPGSYLVIRNGSLIAFRLGEGSALSDGFRIIGAHTDSPSLQLKPRVRATGKHYFQIGVEKYGGALLHTWFDRELSVAGRVAAYDTQGELHTRLLDFKKPLVYIPSLAIHLNREANEELKINVQNEMVPVLAQHHLKSEEQWHELLIQTLNERYPGTDFKSILASDLFCYDPTGPSNFGVADEFISAPRLDNLLSCFIGLRAMLEAAAGSCQPNTMLIFTNHEEIGSTSSSGALGNFADMVLSRICDGLETAGRCRHHSFLLSLDNAHAHHPNFSEKSDPDHLVELNRGPVIKINSSQRYCTNAQSAALFRIICSEAGVEPQDFVMRSDMACGSTIGPLATAGLGLTGVDVGAPTWAMHAIRDVTGTLDPELLFRSASHFFKRDRLPTIGPETSGL